MFMEFEQPDDIVVVCSCGKRTTVRYKRELMKYVADDPNWSFETFLDFYGWNRGELGHKQADHYPLT